MRLKKALVRVFGLFIILIFVAGTYVFATVLLTKNNATPSFFGYSFLTVHTQSMEPAIPAGSVVITRKTTADELKPRDIISFYSTDPAIEGIPNTHRIIAVNKDDNGKTCFVTKGDNNVIADKYAVYPEKVIGRVLGRVRYLGKVIDLFRNQLILFFILIVPLGVIIVFEVKNLAGLLKGRGKTGGEDSGPSEEAD